MISCRATNTHMPHGVRRWFNGHQTVWRAPPHFDGGSSLCAPYETSDEMVRFIAPKSVSAHMGSAATLVTRAVACLVAGAGARGVAWLRASLAATAVAATGAAGTAPIVATGAAANAATGAAATSVAALGAAAATGAA